MDLNKGEILWQVPVGEGSRAIRSHALLKGVTLPARLGSPANGGGIVTAGGLIFMAGRRLLMLLSTRATVEVWRGQLPV
jgi:glucose dehydrogenase